MKVKTLKTDLTFHPKWCTGSAVAGGWTMQEDVAEILPPVLRGDVWNVVFRSVSCHPWILWSIAAASKQVYCEQSISLLDMHQCNVNHSHPWALQDNWGQDACESAGLGLSEVSKWFKDDDSQVWLNYFVFSRSGSSLVGDLVSSIPNASYFFEPLHSFPARTRWHTFLLHFQTHTYQLVAGNIGQISWPQIRKCLQGT